MPVKFGRSVFIAGREQNITVLLIRRELLHHRFPSRRLQTHCSPVFPSIMFFRGCLETYVGSERPFITASQVQYLARHGGGTQFEVLDHQHPASRKGPMTGSNHSAFWSGFDGRRVSQVGPRPDHFLHSNPCKRSTWSSCCRDGHWYMLAWSIGMQRRGDGLVFVLVASAP